MLLALAPVLLRAQNPPQIPPGGAAQLMVQQPPVDVSPPEDISATAGFDPPTAAVGEKIFYRVTLNAAQDSVAWPDKIDAPAELKFGATGRGQISRMEGTRFRPLTAFTCEVTPTAEGHFTVPAFMVNCGGTTVNIPATSVEVTASGATTAPRRLLLEVSETNVFLGQPVRARVMLPAARGNEIEALREIQFNSYGVMTEKTGVRQAVESVVADGQLRPAFTSETVLTPIANGEVTLQAQAFSAGRELSGPIVITGQVTLPGGEPKYTLLLSDTLVLRVRPVPAEGELPGYTGAMGNFSADPPLLSTNRVHVGEPLHLALGFHGAGNLTRFVPPETPRARGWQIIADPPPASGFTLVPLDDEATHTPAIPFCSFDPVEKKYMDLTIPPLPVTVTGEGLPTEIPEWDQAENAEPSPKLSRLAEAPGRTIASLKPLQLQGWFVFLQLLPAYALFILWQWDKRRRFLEAHPDIARRLAARRALKREKIKLRKALTAGDAEKFAQHAVNALRVVVAPHFPAQPQALVCGDVLSQLDEAARNGREGATVRNFFAAMDAQFAGTPQARADLPAFQSDLMAVLQKLEEKL